jgi:P4 family phage/plasmid primase-like protien
LREQARELRDTLGTDEILNEIVRINRDVCDPPLSDDVVAQIYREVSGAAWYEMPRPHRYDLHLRGGAIPGMVEGIQRFENPDGEPWPAQVAAALLDPADTEVVTVEITAPLSLVTLRLVEEIGGRVRPGARECCSAIQVPTTTNLDAVLMNARDAIEGAARPEEVEEEVAGALGRLRENEVLRRYQAALIQRARGYLEHGDSVETVIEILISEDFGGFWWDIRLSDIIGAAQDQVRRANDLASIRNNPALQLTPVAIAEAVAYWTHTELKYVYDLRMWRVWSGVRWEDDPAGVRMQKKIKEVLSSLARTTLATAGADPRVQAEAGRAFKNLLSNGGLKGLGEILARDEQIAVSYTQFATDPYLINWENGTYDLRTFSLRPHSPTDMITNLAGVGSDPDTGLNISTRFDPMADCPTWKGCLEEWFPKDVDQPLHGENVDHETIRALQIRLGYTLAGNAPEDDFLIWYGARGRNGKGVTKDIMLAALGTYATVSDRSLIVETREMTKGSSRGDLKGIIGKRLIFVDELKRSDRLDVQFIKNFTGHGVISFRPPYGTDEVMLKPSGTLILLTNALASVESADSIWDRLRIIPWIKYFGEGERKRDLRTELYRELPGIINWLIDGYRQYVRMGRLPESDAMRSARAKYAQDNNPLADWVADEMILSTDPAVLPAHKHKIVSLRKDLYGYYLNWAQNEGYEKGEYLGRTSFYRELEDKYRGVIQLTTIMGTRYFRGIKLKFDYERTKHTL